MSNDNNTAFLRPSNLPDEVALYSAQAILEEFGDEKKDKILEALRGIYELNAERPRNMFVAFRKYREYSALLLKWALVQQQLQKDTQAELSRMRGKTGERSGKRWSPAEDEALIDQAAKGEPMIALSTRFGRSPGAIASRITYLVGVNRLSQEVAGRITGFIDGEPVDGYFEGELRK